MTAAGIRAHVLVLTVACLGLSLGAGQALAETKSFTADLRPIAGAKTKAEGSMTATYDTDTKKLTWQGSYRGLGTYATGASMVGPGPGNRDRVVVRVRNFDSPFEGLAIVSQKQAADLEAGKWRIVIQTAAFPRGEIGGTLKPAN